MDASNWSNLRERAVGAAGAVGAAIFFLLWQAAHRGLYQYATSIYPFDDADEWRYTACSRLVEHGYALFSQVFSAQPPLLFLSLAAGMHLTQDSIAGARLVEIGFGLLALGSAAWLAWQLGGPLAAGVGSVLLAVSPAFLVYGRAVEAEGPMMALATLSLSLALAARRRRSSTLALVGGLALAASILVKLFALEVAIPVLWSLVAPRGDPEGAPQLAPTERISDASATGGRAMGMKKGRRPNGRLLVPFGVGAAAPVLANFLFVSPADQWSQVVSLHDRAANLALPGLTPPWLVLGQFFTLDLGLAALAAAGLMTLFIVGRMWEAMVLALWVGGTALMLLLFRPLFPHHPAILLTGLAVTAGVGLASLEWGGTQRVPRPYKIRARYLQVLLGAALYVVLIPRLVHDDRHVLVPGYNSTTLALAKYAVQRSSPGSLIAVDDLAVADLSHRLVVPPLCDPSNVRFYAGYLTAAELIAETRRYRPSLVLPSRVFLQSPRYIAWLRKNFAAVPAPDGLTAYLRRKSGL